jgi:hypothetical protein
MSKEFEFKGAGKTTITLDGNFLRIKRKGFLNASNHGLDGEKSIDINNITGVQFKESGITSGYIQFLIKGSSESKGGIFAAARDENSVLFIKKEQKMAEEIKAYVENIMTNKNSSTIVQPLSAADELKKFAELKDAGIITEEEFNAKKDNLVERFEAKKEIIEADISDMKYAEQKVLAHQKQVLNDLHKTYKELLDSIPFGQKRLLKAFPKSISINHKEALEKLRNSIK